MENNDIKKALEICAEDTPYPDQSQALLEALALINSQEQKIFELENRLKECENGYEGTLAIERAKIKKLTDERDTFRECAYNLQNYVNGIAEKQSQGYEPSAAKAAAEMEMWRVVALEKKGTHRGE